MTTQSAKLEKDGRRLNDKNIFLPGKTKSIKNRQKIRPRFWRESATQQKMGETVGLANKV
jgi:hypothetical protein